MELLMRFLRVDEVFILSVKGYEIYGACSGKWTTFVVTQDTEREQVGWKYQSP